ncbi:MAG: hypothetical protein IKI90_05720 [Treponema sp.]|nr:hypothetical protein [Treponema sp.]MBR4005329.1 hypothetical protein [Treponema sp.]
MNKKFLGMLGALLLLGTTSIFSNTAIGLQAGYTVSNHMDGGNVALTFKIAGLPMVFAADASIHPGFFSAGATADYWIANPSLVAILHWYTGPGIAASFIHAEYDESPDFNGAFLGGRWVLGMNIFVTDPLEVYLQAAGELGVTLSDGGVDFPEWRVPFNIGFRYWF